MSCWQGFQDMAPQELPGIRNSQTRPAQNATFSREFLFSCIQSLWHEGFYLLKEEEKLISQTCPMNLHVLLHSATPELPRFFNAGVVWDRDSSKAGKHSQNNIPKGVY